MTNKTLSLPAGRLRRPLTTTIRWRISAAFQRRSFTARCRPKGLKAAFQTRPERRLQPAAPPLANRRIYGAGSLLAALLLIFATPTPAMQRQTSLSLLNCTASLCDASSPAWTITNSANASGLVNGSGPVVWTIAVVKGPAQPPSVLKVTGSITVTNTGAASAPIGNIVINLQKANTKKINGNLVPWISAAADIADATHGGAATRANIVAAGSAESQPFNAAYGAGNYTVSGAEGRFTKTAAASLLTFTDIHNVPISLALPVSLAPGATLTLLYTAGFDFTALGLQAGTLLRVEALVSFANAGARGGSGAAAANIDINGNGVIDANEGPAPAEVRTVPCRVTLSLPAPGIGNDSVTLSDTAADVNLGGSNVTFSSFTTDIGGGTGSEVVSNSVTRTVSVQVACGGSSTGSITNTAHLDGASSTCGLGLALAAASTVPIACTTSTSAGFTNGEFCSYSESTWATDPTISAILKNNYNAVYTASSGLFDVGSPFPADFHMVFTDAPNLLAYIPAVGPIGPLNANLVDPSSSSSGAFGGDVVALKLNVDFNAAGVIQGTGGNFGDLRLCNFTTGGDFPCPLCGCSALTQAQADAVNSQTVAQVLAEANTVLGGGTGTYGLTLCQLDLIVVELDLSFHGCTPSPFAQAHLCRPGFQPGEFCSNGQGNWAAGPIISAITNFNTVYSLGEVGVGLPSPGFSMSFTDEGSVVAYLSAPAGLPGPLDANLSDPTTSSSGVFGKHVLTLKLNVDFSAAGFLHSTGVPFGDMKLCNFTTTDLGGTLTQVQADALNGQTVAQVLAEANSVLGGGTGTYGLTLVQLDSLVFQLNSSFVGCSVSSFALAHLACTAALHDGDFCTYSQSDWTSTLLGKNFGTVYAFGEMGIGLPTPGFSMTFTGPGSIEAYLPAFGAAAPLDANLSDPATSSSGVFGGDVLTLQLNVDFSAAGFLHSTGVPFGNLKLCNFTAGPLSVLTGQTVAQILAEANILLGGGTGTYGLTIADLDPIVGALNDSFIGCTPTPFAQLHLCRPTFAQGEFCSNGQGDWANALTGVLTNFDTVYSTFFSVTVGLPSPGFSMSFGGPSYIEAYLPASGAPGPLDANLDNATTSSAGVFGGNVLALQLDVDFSAAGFLHSTGVPFGALKICNITAGPLSVLTGQTVAQILAEANILLSGGTGTYGLTISQLDPILFDLNGSFSGCYPSSFAQAHLCRP